MKARALIPALALAAALVAPPLADAGDRHHPSRGQSSHGYYGHRPSYGYSGHGYRPARPYYRSPRHYGYYAPPAYYGYGYGAYGYGGYGYDGYAYGYGYYPPPPPPPRYCPPRPRVGFWFGF
jgi:hypothetical protein